MAGSGSINISNFPKVVDKSFVLSQQAYAETPVVYPEIFNTSPPADSGFSVDASIIKGVVGVFDSHVNEDWRPGMPKKEQGGYEDYWWQCRKRYLQSKISLNDEARKVTSDNLFDVLSEWMMAAAANHRRMLDKIAARMINNGVLTAGHSVFNNNEPSYDGSLDAPYSLFIYDGLPWIDTAHPQSRKVTGTTYSNHESTYTISKTNFQLAWTRMTVTNAKDRNGEDIDINPNAVIFNPANFFTVDGILGSMVNDADMQKNTIKDVGLQPLPWRRFEDADGFHMTVRGMGKHIFQWGAPYAKAWYDDDTETSYVSLVTPYGAVITDWRYDFQGGTSAS